MGFKNPGVAATVAVFAKKDKAILLIRRLEEPFKGIYAFPGGHIETDKETLEQAAVRELEEETGVSVDIKSLSLVDTRSEPERDPRGHVIDVGYFCIVDNKKPAKETEEASPEWVPLEKMDSIRFAFDHKLMWERVKKLI